MSSPTVAIVGAGASGCYLAQALRRAWPEAGITVFDRLVAPFGLVRYGVASDHQSTKSVIRQFERVFERDGVVFAGDVQLGRDLTLEQLRSAYDVVVLATGLSADRRLGVPGDDLPGVIGAGEIVRLLNSHPDAPQGFPPLGTRIAIVGAGNVSVDVLRFLVKGTDDHVGSDIHDAALEEYLRAPARSIEVVSRSSVDDAKADTTMLRELGTVPGVRFFAPDVMSGGAPECGQESRRAAVIRDLVRSTADIEPRVEVTFRFGWLPQRVRGESAVEGIDLVSADMRELALPVDAVLTAVGFDLGDTATDDYRSAIPAPDGGAGRVDDSLYRTGWLRRGPRGTIAENRACAKLVAEEILRDVPADGFGRRGFAALPSSVRDRAVTYDEWKLIDAHELATAPEGRTRRKIPDRAEMLAIARGSQTPADTVRPIRQEKS